MGNTPQKNQIVKDALRRFNHLPIRTIARHILNNNKEMFDGDLEKVRRMIRYYTGSTGDRQRESLLDKTFIRDAVVKMPQTWRTVRTSYSLSPGLWLKIADIHIPFHEPKPIETTIKYGQAEKVNGIFINGDMWDCSALSFWKTAHRDFNKEIEAMIDFLDFLRGEFPNAKIVYKPGNHEYRLPSYFMTNAPELAESPLAAMETALGFEERNIEFLDYFQIVMAGKLPIIHGHEVQRIDRSVNPARGLFLRTKTYAACDHCHTTSQHSGRDLLGNLLTTWSSGCLCDLSPDYNPYTNDWNWGCMLINIEKDGNFEVVNRRILPNGVLV